MDFAFRQRSHGVNRFRNSQEFPIQTLSGMENEDEVKSLMSCREATQVYAWN